MIKKSLRAYITCRQFVFLVLTDCKVLRFLLFQFLKKLIHRILKFFVILTGFACVDELQQRGEVLFFLRGFIPDVADQCAVEQAFGLDPEILARLLAIPLCVGDNGIYALFLTGETRTHIAHLLMQEQVPCPARAKGMTGRRFTGEWTPTTIKRILTLPTYYGAVTQHTREMVSYKVHKARFLDSTDWIVVEGTHEGLVTKADFLQAQKLLENRSYTAPDMQPHQLTGLVYCADCGGKLFAHKVGGHFYLTCYTYSRRPGQHLCTSHAIREDWLEAQICDQLRALADGSVDLPIYAQERLRQMAKGSNTAQAERDRLTAQLNKTKKTRLSAYKDLTDGLLTREEFSDITSDLREEEDQLTHRLQALADAPSPAADAESLCEEMQKLLQFTTLNKVQLQQFIKRITVDADRHVTIQFAFQEPHGKDQSSK